MLLFEDFADTLKRINLRDRLVRAQAQDAWESQGVSALVAVRLHHIVEGDLEHDFWIDGAIKAMIFASMRFEPLG